MRAAGVARIGAAVGPLELPEPASPQAGQMLIEARACGVGNWDEIVRTGGWDTGARPPMALGVEAAGLVAAAGAGVSHLRPGDAVTTHAIPAGTWAERFVAAADQVSAVPAGVPMAAAAAFPVPALTADQALAGSGADAAVNAARAGAADAVRAVRDGGRLATITSDPPPAERGIVLADIVVEPDGARLARLAGLGQVRHGTHGAAVVLDPAG